MRQLLFFAMLTIAGTAIVHAQVPKPAKPVPEPVPLTKLVYDWDTVREWDDWTTVIPTIQEEYHLEAWVAEIQEHYTELHEFANVPDLHDPSGATLEWRPPMAAFNHK